MDAWEGSLQPTCETRVTVSVNFREKLVLIRSPYLIWQISLKAGSLIFYFTSLGVFCRQKPSWTPRGSGRWTYRC